MPVFRQGRNPKELRGFYDSQKRIAKRNMKNNIQTGVIGTPKADVDTYDTLIKQIETVENQLEAYVPSVIKLIDDPERATAGNTAELYIALNMLKKTISRITLKALPLTDIQTIKDYKDSLNNYINNMTEFYDTIIGLPINIRRRFNKTELDLNKIRELLSVITQSIDAQISIYDSGVAQPVKIGGCMCYNLDDPKKSEMYQTPKTIEMYGYGYMPTRYM